MTYITKVNEDYSIAIPSEITENLGWDEGDELEFEVVDGKIVVTKVEEEGLRNLFEEVYEHVKTLEDIDYVLVNDKIVPTDWFLSQAKRINYDWEYGGTCITPSLIIVLKDRTWLEREDFNGYEGFVKRKKPTAEDFNNDCDIGVLLHNNHNCSYYNDIQIDGISVMMPDPYSDIDFGKNAEEAKEALDKRYEEIDNKYRIWHEKDGKIIIEEHKYIEGNPKPEHVKMTDYNY